jgi:peptidyl-prolyl cis-trans isomerase SurA
MSFVIALPAQAADQGVVATANDIPITSLDLTARINLWKLLGRRSTSASPRKEALEAIIDDIAKIEEAKKYGAQASDKEIAERLKSVAKGLGTDEAGLGGKLKSQGISKAAMEQYVAAQLAFNRLIVGKYKEKVDVSQADVDAKMQSIRSEINAQVAKIKADPRMQPVTVYELLEVSFPVDSPDLMQARLGDAAVFLGKFKGCGSARAAASGIFNVKIGKKVEADGRKLPPPLKQAFDKAGVGKAIGPVRAPNGFQLYGFCGKRSIKPPPPKVAYPTEDQVKNAVLNEKYGAIEKKYAGMFRKNVVVEYLDPTYAQ